MDALVIGGTGPTGPHVVNGLVERGFDVSILHTGRHEVPELIGDAVAHIHTDPFDGDAVTSALGERTFDLAVAMYGRLRTLAEVLQGRVGRLISIGGVGIYEGFMDPDAVFPFGLAVPTAEDAPLIGPDHPATKLVRMRHTEDIVFDLHPTATHLRYPMIYGPRQLVPREWTIVRRALDGRTRIMVPDGGLTLKSCAFTVNAAHAVLCAVDQPDAAAGKTYNVAEREILSLRQIIELCADELGHQWDVVDLPLELAVAARPMLTHWSSSHRVLDTAAIRQDLGYSEPVPTVDAWRTAIRWLAEHPLEAGGHAEQSLQDPFDYDAEDRLLDAWDAAKAMLPRDAFAVEPGFSRSYRGVRENPG